MDAGDDSEPGQRAARLTRGYCLVELPLGDLATRLGREVDGPASSFNVDDEVKDARQSLDFLSRLTFPPTRHVFFPAGSCWTAAVNNSKNGSDFAAHARRFAAGLGCRAIRVVNEEGRVWHRGKEHVVMAYEARIVVIHAPDGSVSKSITCMNDGGRWTFEISGPHHPVEDDFNYGAKRVRDRFSVDDMARLFRALELPQVTAETLVSAPRFVLVIEKYKNQSWRRRIEDGACTFAQRDDPAYGFYRRGLGWVKHMATHAQSVVADFERAISINPDYEPLVREILARARRVIEQR